MIQNLKRFLVYCMYLTQVTLFKKKIPCLESSANTVFCVIKEITCMEEKINELLFT